MPASQPPPLDKLPSVFVALRWLLGCASSATDRSVAQRAMTDGLVLGTGGANWKADGTTVARLAKMRLKRLPRDPGKLGNLLHGLGEIEARCHTRFLPLLEPPLRMLHRRLDLEKTFDQAARCDHAIPRRVQLETLAFAQWVSRAELKLGHVPRRDISAYPFARRMGRWTLRIMFCGARHSDGRAIGHRQLDRASPRSNRSCRGGAGRNHPSRPLGNRRPRRSALELPEHGSRMSGGRFSCGFWVSRRAEFCRLP